MASAEISGTVESLSSVKPSASNATETTSKVILVGSSARVLLQTARVKVRGARGVTEATILFDTGSDRSYVTSELVGKVGPLWVDSQPIAYSGFGAGNTSKAQMRSIFDLICRMNTVRTNLYLPQRFLWSALPWFVQRYHSLCWHHLVSCPWHGIIL